jgi:hypothetical protein
VKKIGSFMVVAAMACGMAFAQKDNFLFITNDDLAKPSGEGPAGAITVARFGLIGPTVKGAPYAADGVTESSQTLGDGTHINRRETYTIYRDGEGRVRRESGDQVWISDPVAKVSYFLDTKQQTARKLGLSHTVSTPPGAPAMKLTLGPQETGSVFFGSLGSPVADGIMVKDSEPAKPEALGKQEMEGVEVDGTRTTTAIPQGQIGNDRPLQMVHERWESAELHVTILTKHTDPIMGDHTERLTNVRRGEPDPALFQVPAGYSIESEK